MRSRLRVSGLFVLAGMLAILLGALAWLQYHWVGQLSKDERDRMRAHLRARADDFSDDFNRELTRAFLWLQIGPELRRDQEPDAPEARYERWFTASPHPELIKAIYKVDVQENGVLTLQQFQRGAPRLEPTAWPPELTPMRDRFRAQLREPPADPGPPQRPALAMRIPLLWPDVPALLVPAPRGVRGSGGRIVLQFEPGPGQSYTIAVLNAAYLRDQLIPSLVERHLQSEKDGALHVAVRSEKDVVFATPNALPGVLKTPDVVEPLWDIRFFEFSRFVVERHDGSGSKSTAKANAPPAPPSGPPPNVVYRGRDKGPPPVQVSYAREDRPRERDHERDRSRLVGDLQTWYVNVQHPAGSLDAAVANARSRNLLVSFGVLLLLAASMALVLISSARAGRLAAQQMEFVAGVSHELRTPLAVIRSAAENLADGIVNDEKGVRKYGALIAGEGRRLTQMVEQVMTFAGLQAGRPGFDVRPVDVAPVIDSALVAMAPFIHERTAEIASDVPPALPMILADAPAVSRCLENLIANALKYGGDPVRIKITARAWRRGFKEVTQSEDGGARKEQRVLIARRSFVEVTVQDNGAGIGARDLPHIFEPFYRGADAIAKQIHGSGLGLSLVRRIMDELGGSVTVRTETGHGSAFTLHLPVAPEAEPVAAATTAVPAHGGGHRS